MATLGNTPRPGYVYDTETDTWVPIGVGAHTHNYIPTTLVDAKGDILTATADDTPAKLSKGADGTVLVSDSTTSTGLAWQPYAAPLIAGKNKLINGDFVISQRGTTITGIASDNTYTADRWFIERGGTYSYNQRLIGSYNPPAGFKNYAEYICTGATSAFFAVGQIIESANCYQFQGQQVTFSGYIRAGANTTGSKTFYVSIQYSTSVDSKASKIVQASQTVTANYGTAASDWIRFSLTTTIPTNAVTIIPYIASGSQVQNDSMQVTGFQLELGPIATPFTTASGTIGGELALCQRYYYRNTPGINFGSYSIQGIAGSSTVIRIPFPIPVPLRTTPSTIDWSGLCWIVSWGAATTAITNATIYSLGTGNSPVIELTTTGLTAGTNYIIVGTNNTTHYLGLGAEL